MKSDTDTTDTTDTTVRNKTIIGLKFINQPLDAPVAMVRNKTIIGLKYGEILISHDIYES